MGREKEQILSLIRSHIAYEDSRKCEAEAYVIARIPRLPNGWSSMEFYTVTTHRQAALENLLKEVEAIR